MIRLIDSQRILSKEESNALAQRIYAFAKGGGDTRVMIRSWWQGELRWARNRVSLASDRRDIMISVQRLITGRGSNMITNQIDDVSLESAVRAAERASLRVEGTTGAVYAPPAPTWVPTSRQVWSDATYNLTAEARGAAIRSLIDPAEAKGLLSAGYIEVRAGSRMEVTSKRDKNTHALWDEPYTAWTHARCSMTVRDPKGTGSGWAGLSSYDSGAIGTAALAARALEKCVASQNPVALEPGRYTVILEPQAVADLLGILVDAFAKPTGSRQGAEASGTGPFISGFDQTLRLWRTKLGLKIVDERVTISHDPADPMLGIVPEPESDEGAITWIDRGVLTNLRSNREYALEMLNDPLGRRGLTGYRMSGGETSIDEMIQTTRRGLLVTRLSNVRTLDETSLLSTGLTRDGLWLIENGKISKAVKNFRFTESPLFVLNSIEQLGEPVPVFRPTRTGQTLTPAIVPALKARDFSFTSMIDAI